MGEIEWVRCKWYLLVLKYRGSGLRERGDWKGIVERFRDCADYGMMELVMAEFSYFMVRLDEFMWFCWSLGYGIV